METALITVAGLLTAVVAMGVFKQEDEPTMTASQKAERRARAEAERAAIAALKEADERAAAERLKQ
jgi:hypothetical protein